MLRFLFCSAAIIPIFFLPGLLGGEEVQVIPEAQAEAEAEPNSYDAFMAAKLETLEACESAAIGLYFDEEEVTSFSAEYLEAAVAAVDDCQMRKIQLVNLVDETMTKEEQDLAKAQVDEVIAAFERHGIEATLDRTRKEIETTTRLLNGRSVVVEFDFEEDKTLTTD